MAELGLYSDDELAELHETFLLFDTLGDYKIHISQVGEALRSLGQNPRESDIKKYTNIQKLDERISFESFLSVYRAISSVKVSNNLTTDYFVDCLRHFDKDGSGFISSAELRHLLTTLGEKMTDEEVEDLLTGQKDSQGNVNVEEFVDMVVSGCLEVEFPEAAEAVIACNSLKVDKEPRNTIICKKLSVDGNKLVIKFSGPIAKHVRTAVNSFMDSLILVVDTIKRFGPPVAEQYSYYSP